jgi:hypothetical protein
MTLRNCSVSIIDSLGSIDNEQRSLLGMEAALDHVRQQRGRDGRFLPAPFREPERNLHALGGDPRATIIIRALSSSSSSITASRRSRRSG